MSQSITKKGRANNMKAKNEMTIRKNIHGAYMISDVINGYWVGQTYYGYTKKEAVSLFKNFLKRSK